MNACHVERRLAPANTPGPLSSIEIVRNGLIVQQRTGTISAIEYMKSNTIGGAVIQRVLSGNAVRADDQQALRQAVRNAHA